MLVCDRQAGRQADRYVLLLGLTAFQTLGRCSNHLSYGGLKSSPPTFFIFTNSGCFVLGMSLLQTSELWSFTIQVTELSKIKDSFFVRPGDSLIIVESALHFS